MKKKDSSLLPNVSLKTKKGKGNGHNKSGWRSAD